MRCVDLELHLDILAGRRFRDACDARRQQLRHDIGKQRLHLCLSLYREWCGAGAGVLQKQSPSQLLDLRRDSPDGWLAK